MLHKDWDAESKLDDILSEGVVRDVYEAEIANELAEFIGKNADVLNAHYPHLFGELQRMMTGWIFLAIARVFEERSPRSRYPIRSIAEALKILEAGNVLIHSRAAAIRALNMEESEKKRLAEVSDDEFLKSTCLYFRERLSALSTNIEMVKEKRDKVIAHREAIDEAVVKRPKWDEIDDLIAFAKYFYEVVGKEIIGRHIESDPARLTRSFKRLLTNASVTVS